MPRYIRDTDKHSITSVNRRICYENNYTGMVDYYEYLDRKPTVVTLFNADNILNLYLVVDTESTLEIPK